MSAEPTSETLEETLRPWPKGLDPKHLAKLASLLAVYALTAKLGLLMEPVSGFATTVWPPTGLALVALALFGSRLWPAIAIGAFLVNLSAGAPILTACGMAAGNTLEAVLGATLLRRYVGLRGAFDRLQRVVVFIMLVAGLTTCLSATIGVASGWLGGVIPTASIGAAWLTWWLGDALGDLVLAPMLLVWTERPRLLYSPWRWVEALGLLVSLVLASLLVFGPWFTVYQMAAGRYVLFPFLIWAGLRFPRHGSVTATFVIATMAIWRTAQGFGPFTMETVNESLFSLQTFMGVVAVTMLIFAASVTERRRTATSLRVHYSAARVLADASSQEEVLPGILRAICDTLDWDCGNVWLVDADSNTLRYWVGWCRPGVHLEEFSKTAPGLTFHPGVGLAGRVWSEGRPVWVAKLADEPNIVRAKIASSLGLRSAMGFPILLESQVHGVMTFFSRKIQDPDETLLQFMATLGSEIGLFIERRRAEADLRLAHSELEARIERRTEQLSRSNRALQDEVAERRRVEGYLRQLSSRLLRVQDEERQRLARDLHDSTAQGLAALSMNLAVAQESRGALGERARVALDECDVLAERCSREIRSLSYLLHPPLLEEVGLPAALRWCAEGFARRSGISVEVDLPADFGRLPMDVENALFRIVQECLANIHRHSGSPTARIQLGRNSSGVILEVKDQGRGMPEGIMNRNDGYESLGVGLLGMRERVRQLGGQLRIDSSHKGATVQVEIQLPSEGA